MQVFASVAAVIVLLTAGFTPVVAQTPLSKPMTAGFLNTSCSPVRALGNNGGTMNSLTRDEMFMMGLCIGFIDGWLQGTRNALLDENHGNTNAFTDKITTSQLIPVFLAYMAKHPEQKEGSAGLVLFEAVVEEKLEKLR